MFESVFRYYSLLFLHNEEITFSPQLEQRSRERTEGEDEEEKIVEIVTTEEKNVLENPTSDVSVSKSSTFNGKVDKQADARNPGMVERKQVGWPTLPGSFFQNLDSPFLGKDDKMFNSLKPEFDSHLRKNEPVPHILDCTETPIQKSKVKPKSKRRNRNNIFGGVERKWRAGEEGKEDVRRRRKVVARLRKLRKESEGEREEGAGVGGRDEEEEEKAILILEAKEGGVSLYKRIMDYTSKDFSARTDPTTAIVNAASRHLD